MRRPDRCSRPGTRRVRRGEEPLDVERSEVRELVTARNRRRVNQGKEPLDVEAEVSRQLAELG